MAANANVRALMQIFGTFSYASGTSSANFPAALGPSTIAFSVTGSGVGVASKGFAEIQLIIPASSAFTLDLSSFVDGLGAAASWTDLKGIILEHNAASLATGGIDFTGAAANAIPSLRGSFLVPGEGCVPYYASSTTGSGTAGKAFTGPNSRIVIQNLDAANPATIDLFLLGE